MINMYKKQQQQQPPQKKPPNMSNNNHIISCTNTTQEVSSMEWEFINMSQQEEDLIYRMHNIVGDRWALIAGRIPGRTAEEIERFWIMKHSQAFAHKTQHHNNRSSSSSSSFKS